jgi:hypothetical protein
LLRNPHRLVVTEVSDGPFGRDPLTDINSSGPVGNVDAVKVQPLAVLGNQTTVTTALIEGLDPSVDHYFPREPWRSTDTISRAVVAASRPLLFSSFAERSSA